jgi:hypothetical protein
MDTGVGRILSDRAVVNGVCAAALTGFHRLRGNPGI